MPWWRSVRLSHMSCVRMAQTDNKQSLVICRVLKTNVARIMSSLWDYVYFGMGEYCCFSRGVQVNYSKYYLSNVTLSNTAWSGSCNHFLNFAIPPCIWNGSSAACLVNRCSVTNVLSTNNSNRKCPVIDGVKARAPQGAWHRRLHVWNLDTWNGWQHGYLKFGIKLWQVL